MLQQTYLRLRKAFRAEDIYLATLEEQLPFVKKQIPHFVQKNISAEPLRKETSAAILLAIARIHKRDPQAEFVNIWSDAYVGDDDAYIATLQRAKLALKEFPNHIIMIGVNPTYPETGYGYIKMGKPVLRLKGQEIFEVEKFVEKPTLAQAKKYLQDWRYLWNPTMLIGKTDTMLRLYREHLPASHRIMVEEIMPALGTSREKRVIKHWYPRMQKIPIDYAILEKAKNLLVMPADFGWIDVGSWRTVKDVLSKGTDEVITDGEILTRDCKDVLAYSYTDKKVMALIGLEGYIVIDTKDALLICHKEKTQEVKKIVEELEQKNKKRYL
jgi:mannose-1-phosphate guanylyltransferase